MTQKNTCFIMAAGTKNFFMGMIKQIHFLFVLT